MGRKPSPLLDYGDQLLIRNMSTRGGTENMQLIWREKIHVVAENVNNENITYIMEGFEFYIETFYHTTIRRQNLPKKNDNVEESVTDDEDDDSGTGKNIEYTPREIQMFSRKDTGNTKKSQTT